MLLVTYKAINMFTKKIINVSPKKKKKIFIHNNISLALLYFV